MDIVLRTPLQHSSILIVKVYQYGYDDQQLWFQTVVFSHRADSLLLLHLHIEALIFEHFACVLFTCL